MERENEDIMTDEEGEINVEFSKALPVTRVRARGVVSAVLLMCALGVACNLCIVWFFLSFIEGQVTHADKVDDLRIQTCHETSSRAVEAMQMMSRALIVQSDEWSRFKSEMTHLISEVEENQKLFEDLLHELEMQRELGAENKRR